MEDADKKRLEEVVSWLEREYTAIRTGQAAPALLDNIKVESYGTLIPIPQVGSVGIEDARTLRVAPWDTQMVASIERAIQEADLGVSVATDSSGLRVIFPELTSERRTQLNKLAKGKLEEARVSVRNVRDDIMKQLEKSQKAGDLSEDALHTTKQQVQKAIDDTNQALEKLFTHKEAELAK